MVKPKMSEKKAVGKDFLIYLKETNRGNITEKSVLASIYTKEFRPSHVSGVGFSFCAIFNALRLAHQVKVENDQVLITSGFVAKDQYRTLKKHALDLDASVAGKGRGSSQHQLYCSDCDIRGNSAKSFQGHLTGKKHFKQMSLKYLKNRRMELMENRNGIEVTSSFDNEDGAIATSMDMEENGTKKIDIMVRNTSDSEIRFLACVFLKDQPAFTFGQRANEPLLEPDPIPRNGSCPGIDTPQRGPPTTLVPRMEFSIEVLVKSDCISILQSPLLMAFNPVNDKTVFHILRFLKVEVQSEIAADLPPSVPYQRPSRESRRQPKGEVVEGVPPPLSNRSQLKMGELNQYFIPNRLRHQINNKYEMEEVKRNIASPLSWNNYAGKQSDLLHIEECQMEVDIRRYDMRGATMTKDGRFLRLRVPGLAENRPSVLRGDHLFACSADDREKPNPKKYKGYVHRVEMEELVLGFSPNFVASFFNGLRFDIEFTFSRRPLRLQHFAIQEAIKHDRLKKMLFPATSDIGRNKQLLFATPPTIRPFDRKLNTEQLMAIQHILQGTSRPAPYLVFGPPGTGKTVTIVEAIKQVYSMLPSSRILACAPSNSAADLIAKRLLTGTGTPVQKVTLFRINALSRDLKTMDQDLKECCNYDPDAKDTFFPSKEDLLKKRILVTTLCTAGRLATAEGFPYDHFTHVFIDEAGHAVEPEAIIAISNLLNPSHPVGGQVVLAGDPKQLGPILRSPLAIEHGLELSLLERFMTKCEVYERQEEEPHYNSQVLTKLLQNYRSHPAILKLPNQMFYENELEVYADEMVRESLCGWERLPKRGFPIIFHGVEGVDEREGQSPSFFNKKEIEIVIQYVKDLLNKRGGMRVKESDIGIISPYRRQVQKIKEVLKLKKNNITEVKVGSVEEFQGQERLVIIVSTVRSTKPEYIQMDIDHHLGFVKNPKRLNVAVTRAKALLVIVGNPYMLTKDENWNKFLQYCLENKAYTGCPYKNEEDELDDTLQKFKQLKLTTDLVDKPAEDLGVSALTEQHDPEWPDTR